MVLPWRRGTPAQECPAATHLQRSSAARYWLDNPHLATARRPIKMPRPLTRKKSEGKGGRRDHRAGEKSSVRACPAVILLLAPAAWELLQHVATPDSDGQPLKSRLKYSAQDTSFTQSSHPETILARLPNNDPGSPLPGFYSTSHTVFPPRPRRGGPRHILAASQNKLNRPDFLLFPLSTPLWNLFSIHLLSAPIALAGFPSISRVFPFQFFLISSSLFFLSHL